MVILRYKTSEELSNWSEHKCGEIWSKPDSDKLLEEFTKTGNIRAIAESLGRNVLGTLCRLTYLDVLDHSASNGFTYRVATTPPWAIARHGQWIIAAEPDDDFHPCKPEHDGVSVNVQVLNTDNVGQKLYESIEQKVASGVIAGSCLAEKIAQSRIDRGGYASQVVVHGSVLLPSSEMVMTKETEMKTNVKIERRVYINDVLASTISDDKLVELLAELETRRKFLAEINAKSELVNNQIADIDYQIGELVDYMDSRAVVAGEVKSSD